MPSKVRNIALLTSGGDAPGMNACIRAVVRTCLYHKIGVFGVSDGYNGLIQDHFHKMEYSDVSNLLQTGGTILGTARCKEFHDFNFRKLAFDNLKNMDIEGLITIGGNGTFKGASVFSKEFDVPVIGIPATIDNDINGTDYTIGFDTALNTIIHAVDNIRDTAASHHRIFLVEVMGNNSGQLALHAAVASGAREVFMPEKNEDLPEIREKIKQAIAMKRSSMIIVSEGEVGGADKVKQYLDEHGLASKIRVSVLGHIQRGGRPSYKDRFNAALFGEAAVVALIQGKSNLMVGLTDGKLRLQDISLAEQDGRLENMDYLKLIRKLSVY